MNYRYKYDDLQQPDMQNFMPDDLFSEESGIPSEKNPFCNDTEDTAYNESYSYIIPDFFFRTDPCQPRPAKAEMKALRRFCNSTGIVLVSGMLLFFGVFVFAEVISLLLNYAANLSTHSFGYILRNTTVLYSCASIAAVVTVPVMHTAGCRASKLDTGCIFRGRRSMKTSEMVYCVMTGLFIVSAGNFVMSLITYFTGLSPLYEVRYTNDIKQTAAAAVFSCVLVPVAQGLIFRGFVLKNMSRAGQKCGIYAASFLCAVSSLRVSEVIPVFLFSLLLSRLTVKYDSVIPGICIHMTVNFCNTFILVYRDVFMNSDEMVTRVWTMVTLAAGAVFAGVCIIKERSPGIRPGQLRRSAAAFLTSPFLWIFVIINAAVISACILYVIL